MRPSFGAMAAFGGTRVNRAIDGERSAEGDAQPTMFHVKRSERAAARPAEGGGDVWSRRLSGLQGIDASPAPRLGRNPT